ncbi:26S proteasome non-ATPase regulatory subunit 12 isoform X2 [Phascolarctos cinereus]|uniref:26S proteasome non-ATPase regulatory subunit 12 n=1 Tax=Phascolarctos cinereus TaxID=38626 RepID=A0A6P5LL89_PHACI|nr:26S proteasome non-ATPase regulatory subunit 12 isoform X2 [Phascolarctos cinereus]
MADGGAERADGRIVKMEVDYSATVDQRLPECESMAKEGRLQEVIETLLSLEKQTRTASDMVSTSRILVAVVKMCYEAKEWDFLNENIILLSKRRSQLKQIYVEIERARLTKTLATIKEQSGEVKEAASILQELQVETYGSMEKKERVEFILEQMRLCLAVKDYIRTQIISKKINTKFFQEENTEKLKLKYYNLMIQLDQHEGSYLSICKHYRAIYDTPCIQAESEKWQQALKSVVLYVILSPFDNEQSDLVHRISSDKKLEEIPKYKDLLKLFTTMELMRWTTLVEDYGKELREGSLESPATDVFGYTEEGEKRWKDLKNRVVEHNIRIMAKYYTRITMKRMAQLLDLSVDESEAFLSNLVVNKTIFAKVDRLAGIINFQRPKDPNNLLNDWSQKLNSLMSLVNKTTHLIAKEEMIHNLQ